MWSCALGTKTDHHHHHLFLKRPFLPSSARVRRFSRYEASPHIHEHCPFTVQTKLIRIILHTFSPSLPAPTCTSHPTTTTFLQADTQSSPIPHAQTTSIYHASPPQPCSEHLKKTVQIHTSYRDTHFLLPTHTSYTHFLLPTHTSYILQRHTTQPPHHHMLCSPGSADSQPSLPMSQSHVSAHSGHRP